MKTTATRIKTMFFSDEDHSNYDKDHSNDENDAARGDDVPIPDTPVF